MVVPLLIVGVVAALAATAVSMSAQQQAAKQQATLARYGAAAQHEETRAAAFAAERNAQVAEQEALAEQQALAYDLATFDRRVRALEGEEDALVAAAGLEVAGSPLLVLGDNARERALQRETAVWESEQRVAGLADEARLQRFQAEEFGRAGRSALQLGDYQARAALRSGRLAMIGTGLQGLSSAAGTAYSGYLLSTSRVPTTR